MKHIIILVLAFQLILGLNAQSSQAERLQMLEENNQSQQENTLTATMKSSSRLFGTKDDLTTVILIIPSGSVVSVLDTDSTYYQVLYEDNEGYIFKRHADINRTPVSTVRPAQQSQAPKQEVNNNQPQEKKISRFSYLESKYGSNMAARLIAGKIWKGMNSEMVKDSWGTAEKVNRVISGNLIKEEWIFNNTWLYFENNTLVEWGPLRN